MDTSYFAKGKGDKGCAWTKNERNENYYYLKDIENLVVMQVMDICESVVFEDETCREVRGRTGF